MARTVNQIMKELDKSGGYAADRQLLQQQLNELPGQAKAQISGLDAQLSRANNQILEGARGRGLGFSGIPIAEQAQYAATEYAPAVARVKQSQNEAKRGILGSLNSLSRDMRSQAQSMYENDRSFAEQRRQFNEQMRLQRENAARAAASGGGGGSSAGDYLAALLGGGGGSQPKATFQNSGGNFQFADASGKSITAAQYAKATNQPIGSVLRAMGQAGNERAALLYNQLRNVANDKKAYNRALSMYKQQFPYVFGGV